MPLILYSIIILVFVGGAVLFTRISANRMDEEIVHEEKDYESADIFQED